MSDLVQKVEGAKQEINTGMTLIDMWAKQAAAMEALDHKEIRKHFTETIYDYIDNNYSDIYMLNSKSTNYMTIFLRNNRGDDMLIANEVVDFIFDELVDLKMYTDEGNVGMVQMFIGELHYAFFDCSHLVA